MNDMTVKPNMKIEPDLERVRKLESALEDFRLFFESQGAWAKTKHVFRHQFRDYYFVLAPMWRVMWRSRNWKQRMLPNFTSTGAIRSGTSAMSNYLLQHPAVVLPLTKELATHLPRESFVRAQFPHEKEAIKIREKYGIAMTADCTPISPSISWIYWGKALNPNMRVVLMMRDPVDRLMSHWRWNSMLTGLFSKDPLWRLLPDFSEAMRIEMRDFARGGCGFHLFSGAGGSSFLRHSVYLPFVRVLFEQVGRENVMIVNANEFFKNPAKHAREVYNFVGLPDYEPVEIKETNPSPPMDIDATIQEELAAFFKPLNEELYDFIGRDFNWKR